MSLKRVTMKIENKAGLPVDEADALCAKFNRKSEMDYTFDKDGKLVKLSINGLPYDLYGDLGLDMND